jgi:HAD superfamily hydrolase (TIGR01509 family)
VAPNPPAAVLFDNDGLTLDTEVCWTRAETTLFARRGRTFTLADKQALLGTAAATAIAGLERLLDAPGEGAALLEELHVLVWDELEHVDPMPGALELLDALQAAGTPVGMASNSPRALVDRALAGAGIVGRFDHVLSAEQVAHPKPAPDVYLELAATLGVAAADCVALEDSPPGVAAARAAGCTVIGVPALEGIVLDADLVAPSLGDPAVHALVGLRP